MSLTQKYYKYQLIFPFEGNKIYRSKSLDKVIKKCYNECKDFKELSTFTILNIDKNIVYHVELKNSKQI